jgi:hypothetical protein
MGKKSEAANEELELRVSEKEFKKISKKAMISAAKDLNEALDLNPPIEVSDKKTDKETLCKDIYDVADDHLDPTEDELEDETWDTLEGIGAAKRPEAGEGEGEGENEGTDEGGEDVPDYEDALDDLDDADDIDDVKEIAKEVGYDGDLPGKKASAKKKLKEWLEGKVAEQQEAGEGEEEEDPKEKAKKHAEAKGRDGTNGKKSEGKGKEKDAGEKKKGPEKGKVPPQFQKKDPESFEDLPAKAQVYIFWQNGETDAEKLAKKCGGGAQASTIKSWLKAWSNEVRLPAIAKKPELLKKFSKEGKKK